MRMTTINTDIEIALSAVPDSDLREEVEARELSTLYDDLEWIYDALRDCRYVDAMARLERIMWPR